MRRCQAVELSAIAPPVKEIRKISGLTQRQLAFATGIPRGSIAMYECGQRDSLVARRLVWLTFFLYLLPDPVNGWVRAGLLQNPVKNEGKLEQILEQMILKAQKTPKKRHKKKRRI